MRTSATRTDTGDTTRTEHVLDAVDRRTVLRAAGLGGAVLAAGATLAACGSDSATTPTGGGSTSTGSGSAGSGSTGGGGSAAEATVPVADVPVGGGKVLAAEKVVVTQPEKGTFKAFSAVCTHMGCTVASVTNGIIRCPCHGSTYSAVDGSVQGGPATRALAPKTAKVEGSDVVVA